MAGGEFFQVGRWARNVRARSEIGIVRRTTMRLKQLLGSFVLLLVATGSAAAAGSQLNNVAVASTGSTATVTIHATGAFTHNEYRPENKVLLVDLAGVSSANLLDKQKTLNKNTKKTKHEHTNKGPTGAEVTRIE